MPIPTPRRARLPSVAGTVVAALLAAAPAAGLEWQTAPVLTLGSAHDTNIALQPSEERAVTSTTVRAATDIVARNERVTLRLKPEARSIDYDKERELDRDDVFGTFALELTGARQTWTVGGNYARESTLTSEFEGTGFVQTDVDRVSSSVNAAWSRRAGVRGVYQVQALASDVDYGEALFSPLVDYRYRVLQASYVLAASGRSTWQMSASRSLIQNEATRGETSSTSITATWSRRFSEVLNGRIGLGAFDVASGGARAATDTGVSFDLGMERTWAHWQLAVSAARNLEPDGRGTLVRGDVMTVRALRRVTTRLSVGAVVRGARVREADLPAVFDRDYSSFRAELDWRLGERWTLRCELGERVQQMPFTERARGMVGAVAASYRGR